MEERCHVGLSSLTLCASAAPRVSRDRPQVEPRHITKIARLPAATAASDCTRLLASVGCFTCGNEPFVCGCDAFAIVKGYYDANSIFRIPFLCSPHIKIDLEPYYLCSN